MLWRLAARLITGPLAFFIAGVLDLGALALVTIRDSIRRRSKTRHASYDRPTDSCEERE